MNTYTANPIWLLSAAPIVLFAVAGIVLVAVQIREYACHRQDLRFKRELIEQGYSVDEIERLIAGKNNLPSSR
jgi:hypothetical protein